MCACVCMRACVGVCARECMCVYALMYHSAGQQGSRGTTDPGEKKFWLLSAKAMGSRCSFVRMCIGAPPHLCPISPARQCTPRQRES